LRQLPVGDPVVELRGEAGAGERRPHATTAASHFAAVGRSAAGDDGGGVKRSRGGCRATGDPPIGGGAVHSGDPEADGRRLDGGRRQQQQRRGGGPWHPPQIVGEGEQRRIGGDRRGIVRRAGQRDRGRSGAERRDRLTEASGRCRERGSGDCGVCGSWPSAGLIPPPQPRTGPSTTAATSVAVSGGRGARGAANGHKRHLVGAPQRAPPSPSGVPHLRVAPRRRSRNGEPPSPDTTTAMSTRRRGGDWGELPLWGRNSGGEGRGERERHGALRGVGRRGKLRQALGGRRRARQAVE